MTGPVAVANAPFRWTRELVALAERAAPLLAADGGANRLARIGLKPDVVVGDLDSMAAATRRFLGEERLLECPDQERTDLAKLLHHAFDELGLGRLTVLGAVGGRIDHTQANLGLLACYGLGEALQFRTEDELLWGVRGELELEAAAGETWSSWTYDPAVRVTLTGVRWPVSRAPLDAGNRPSISNLAVGARVRVVAEGGAVVVMRQLRRHRNGPA
jgi:thiamine pyrophosphokinase